MPHFSKKHSGKSRSFQTYFWELETVCQAACVPINKAPAWAQPRVLITNTHTYTNTPVITSPSFLLSVLFTFVFLSDVLVCLNEVLLVCIRREADGFIHSHGQGSLSLVLLSFFPSYAGGCVPVCVCVSVSESGSAQFLWLPNAL